MSHHHGSDGNGGHDHDPELSHLDEGKAAVFTELFNDNFSLHAEFFSDKKRIFREADTATHLYNRECEHDAPRITKYNNTSTSRSSSLNKTSFLFPTSADTKLCCINTRKISLSCEISSLEWEAIRERDMDAPDIRTLQTFAAISPSLSATTCCMKRAKGTVDNEGISTR